MTTALNRLRIVYQAGAAKRRGPRLNSVTIIGRRIAATSDAEQKVQITVTEHELIAAMREAGYHVSRVEDR